MIRRYKDSGAARPALRKSHTMPPMQEKSFEWPALPGKPRTVFKPRSKRIKTAVKENH